MDLQFEAMTTRIDQLENTLSTAISHLTSLVTRLARHQGLPLNHSHRIANEEDEEYDESDDDDEISSTEAESSARDDEERRGKTRSNTNKATRKASRKHSDSDYTLSATEDD
ncbi:hypothetical protein QN277_023411 [Acacia crassicarpa]|uniref:Uncharacterized protein n=1 Tax=Acacia crassicarpa TaxID=499986 RepID=A0AAE1MRL7_9FABA|nr:hypothetical protein QN277_023411 [Acacia crassicarpa]